MSKKECDGCCQRVTCTQDLEKCCYLVGRKCIINARKNKHYALENNMEV